MDDDVINAVAEEAFYMKRPLTKYLCEEEYEVNFKDYPLGKNLFLYNFHTVFNRKPCSIMLYLEIY